jgi:DNA-cytosine methyltransferase
MGRLRARSNIALARQHDQSASSKQQGELFERPRTVGALAGSGKKLNVVELFAGAGGMGLGFLLANRRLGGFRLVFSGEVNPVYVETLRRNHATISRWRGDESVQSELCPIDLRLSGSIPEVKERVRDSGGVDVLIGGPPCRGFSMANRNSWRSTNPNNELVEVFLNYVDALQPPVVLMENVQGILWTARGASRNKKLGVVDHLSRRFAALGYLVFPKLLDAVWYGVPQFRSRFFLLGIRRDLGYRHEDFGTWGPFPTPTHGPSAEREFVNVRDAIRDLPRIGNGDDRSELPYVRPLREHLRENGFLQAMRARSPRNTVSDHVTSQHADYVIDRYRRIPQGGNWRDIADSLTNYSDPERTHSNIYRRLSWNDPSITIGHYRKSMMVHPSQNRGLSLREASRLQSFPDWFRFSGSPRGRRGGLLQKQQQLGNAVCPLVAKALAEFIMRL